MLNLFACPSCRTILKPPPDYRGAAVACPRCGQPMFLPPRPPPAPSPVRQRRLIPWLGAALVLLAAAVVGLFLSLPRDDRREAPPIDLADATNRPPEVFASPSEDPPPAPPAPADEPARPPVRAADAPKHETPPPNTPPAPPVDGVVLYPVDGQQRLPLAFPGHELPDPIPDAAGAATGYPITATFPPAAAVKKARVTLQDADGREVAGWASSPEQPANPAYSWAQKNTICFIARRPLAAGAAYTVRMSAEVDGKEWARAWKFTTAGEGEGLEQAVDALVQRLNEYRRAAGLRAVSADPDLSAPCAAHARYLEKNYDEKDLNWNDEDESLPGCTAAGRRAARRSSVNAGAGPTATADWAVASFITRTLVLDRGLRKVGVGGAAHLSGGFIWVIDAQGDRDRAGGPADAVVFPTPDQQDVPTAYPSGEGLLPVPDPDGKTRPGYAVTALFPQDASIEGVKARLTDDAGKEVEAWLSTPDRPAIKGVPQHSIALIPRAPLRADSRYTATMSAKVGGADWRQAWSFRTAGDSEQSEEALTAAALAALNAYRRTAGLPPAALDADLSKGCRLHARYLARNIDQPAVQGLGMHEEDAALPGATAEGRRAGQASVITQEPDADRAVDGWMDTFFHRVPLLDPDLKRVGYGCARAADRTWICVMDAGHGR